MWQAIVFDLDDTLYLERDYVFSGFRAVAFWAESHLGLPAAQSFAELRCLFARGVRGDTFNRWLDGHALAPANLVPQIVQVYRKHKPEITPFPGVTALLVSLRHRYRLGLVSDGYLSVQESKLAALNLADHFDAITFSDTWGRDAWKPSTRPFDDILRQLAVEATQAVYVADNPIKDFLGARQIGMFTIQIRPLDGEYVHLTPPTAQHAPHLTFASLVELEQLFLKTRRRE